MSSKKAIVTGASRGIGRGIAKCLAENGYHLAISYYTKREEAAQLARYIREKTGQECYYFQASLEKPGEGVKLFEKAVEKLGGLDLLVNNAGVTIFENILEMKTETLEFLINLNFKNYFVMMQAAARYMVRHGIKGSIINITSSRGERAYPGDALYGGLKAGMDRAIKSVALDLAPYGIRVNNVAPGAIRIRSAEELNRERPDMTGNFWDELGGRIPLGRSGLPEDIGHAVVFLASDKASYITGITLRVDGGLILPGMPERPDPEGKDKGWGYAGKVIF